MEKGRVGWLVGESTFAYFLVTLDDNIPFIFLPRVISFQALTWLQFLLYLSISNDSFTNSHSNPDHDTNVLFAITENEWIGNGFALQNLEVQV